MLLQEKEPMNALGIYCHVPFCASTCDFCAFYQEKPRRSELDRYLTAMDVEFEQLPKDRMVDTVFWGGGTPGLLAAKDLERLGQSMLSNLRQPPREWTIEMAPSTVKADKLKVLKELGVTRISMGVQSFDAELLDSLGRLHRPNQIYKAWDLIQAEAFEHTNLDLMFAIPNQSLEQWEASIREAAALGPDHLSTYCLTFEEDTALYVKLSKGELKIDEARELRFYERGWELLEELGYAQYEISNFAKEGGECTHNLNTWRMTEWIGCGPSAASQYCGERYQRPAHLQEWSSQVLAGNLPKEEVVLLNADMLLVDSVVFGLRMNRGIDFGALLARFDDATNGDRIWRLLKELEREGLLIICEQEVRLTHGGQLVCDAIGSALLEL